MIDHRISRRSDNLGGHRCQGGKVANWRLKDHTGDAVLVVNDPVVTRFGVRDPSLEEREDDVVADGVAHQKELCLVKDGLWIVPCRHTQGHEE